MLNNYFLQYLQLFVTQIITLFNNVQLFILIHSISFLILYKWCVILYVSTKRYSYFLTQMWNIKGCEVYNVLDSISTINIHPYKPSPTWWTDGQSLFFDGNRYTYSKYILNTSKIPLSLRSTSITVLWLSILREQSVSMVVNSEYLIKSVLRN